MSENVVIKTTLLLEKWQKKCRTNQRGHLLVANRLLQRNRLIGVPAVILAAALGSGLLSTAQIQLAVQWRIVAGMAGIAAAILTSVQLSADYHGLAERHRLAGVRFDSLHREIEQFLASSLASEDVAVQAVDRIRRELNALFEQSPALAPKLLDERRMMHSGSEGRSGEYDNLPRSASAS